MKKYYLLLAVMLSACSLAAQPAFLWAKRASAQRPDALCVDPGDNAYISWPVGDHIPNVDGHVFGSYGLYGDNNWAISSYTCDGSYRWTKVIGGKGTDRGWDIGADTLGGIYALGSVQSDSIHTIDVGGDTTIKVTQRKFLMVKYDTAGRFQWLRMPEAEGPFRPRGGTGFQLCVEPNGDLHVFSVLEAGVYADGAFTATHTDSAYIYDLRYDKDGNFRKGVHLEVTMKPQPYAVAAYGLSYSYDPVRKQYYYAGRTWLDSLWIGTQQSGPGTGFIAAFDSSGKALWLQQSATTVQLLATVSDEQGNLYVGGTSSGALADDTLCGFPLPPQSPVPYGYPFVMRLDPRTGKVIWGHRSTTTGSDSYSGALAVGHGLLSLGVSGAAIRWEALKLSSTPTESNNVSLARFNTETGKVRSLDSISCTGMYDNPSLIRPDNRGNLYIGGAFQGTMTIKGKSSTIEDDPYDAFIARYGLDACDCSTLKAAFTYTAGSTGTCNFTYTGTGMADSVIWLFGDGSSDKGNTATHTYSSTADSFTVCAIAYNSCGSNMSCRKISAMGTDHIPEQDMADRIDIYPNPAQRQLQVLHAAGMHAEIFNILGQRLVQVSLSAASAGIDISVLQPGLYLLRCTDSRGYSKSLQFIRE